VQAIGCYDRAIKGGTRDGDSGAALVRKETGTGREGGAEDGEWVVSAVEEGTKGLDKWLGRRMGRDAMEGVEKSISCAERKQGENGWDVIAVPSSVWCIHD